MCRAVAKRTAIVCAACLETGVLPPVSLRGDRARERARGRAKALTLCADGHTQGSAHEHAQAEGVHLGAGPLGAASRHQLAWSGPPGIHAARPRTELRHRTDGLRTTSSTRRSHRLRQKTTGTLRVRPTSTHRPRASTLGRVPWAQRPGINWRGVDLRDFTRPDQEPSYGIGQMVYARRPRLGDLIGSDKKMYATP
ncbi:hypothetical protein HPB51_002242 [Rhipicephalus microplus]|uniref:Uncharacterized protein n=1 Tax=Rhipicephalus microplus TaxID=6941 RepID=A0A9J6EVN3_RHIMP|nr:hypothetical protein HPB51_002242 [Rhipicephalus microplus]